MIILINKKDKQYQIIETEVITNVVYNPDVWDVLNFDTEAKALKHVADNGLTVIGDDTGVDEATLHGYEHITDRDELKTWITDNGLAGYFDLRSSLKSLKTALDEYFGV